MKIAFKEGSVNSCLIIDFGDGNDLTFLFKNKGDAQTAKYAIDLAYKYGKVSGKKAKK